MLTTAKDRGPPRAALRGIRASVRPAPGDPSRAQALPQPGAHKVAGLDPGATYPRSRDELGPPTP